MKKYTAIVVFCFMGVSVFSQSYQWREVAIKTRNFSKERLKFRKSVPQEFKVYSVDYQAFKNQIISGLKTQPIIVKFPTVQGVQKFLVKEAPSMSVRLTQKFPMIKSYVASGIEDPSATVRFSFGTDGFHAVIFYADGPTLYIDPYTKDCNSYIVYSRLSVLHSGPFFSCEVEENTATDPFLRRFQRTADDGLLRIFRLALVCSGEYAEFHLNDQAISNDAPEALKKAAVLSAMNTSMTRVNGVFERDMGVRMQIIDNNDELIFLDPATDGITDGNAGAMINQVQTICDTVIGSDNYDIGHLFSVAGSGLAGLGVVCNDGNKAKGVTGRSFPISDPYDIDYVAHEIGHQFGANHTFNNSCNGNRNNATAVEPGSASTIMGYAGICPPNIQSNSDDHFHSVSISEMWNRIQTSASCATTTLTDNTAPTVAELNDYFIPKSTPFILRASATDIDSNDVLSYNWEQIDPEIAPMPPSSESTSGPNFRSLSSSIFPDRYLPSLPTIVNGNTGSEWEVLPSVVREMNFSVLIRDNAAGGGNSTREDLKVFTVDIAPFAVDEPSASADWEVNSLQTITWTVGETDKFPVNCQEVSVLLSIDGGVSFPIFLASNIANDGSETIVVPNTPTLSARIMVVAEDNIFYNVNASNFTISEQTTSVDEQSFTGFALYPNPSKGIFRIRLDNVSRTPIQLQLFDLTGRLVKEFSYDNGAPKFDEVISFENNSVGFYFLKIMSSSRKITVKLMIE